MTTSPPARMSIGEFSTLTRLSHRALRLYDSRGLLPPAEVDERSGYRYYTPEQAETARTIRLLRGVGVPLATIGELLGLSGPSAAESVRAYWRDAERSHAARRELAHYLIELLEDRVLDRYEIRTRTMPDQKIVSTLRNVAVEQLPAFIAGAGAHLVQHVASSAAEVAGAAFVVYHGDVTEDSTAPVEVCVPADGAVEPAVDGAYPVGVRVEPAHTEAYARITKADVRYPAILPAYEAVARWLASRGEHRTGPPREVYFIDFHAAAEDEPACDVAFPYSPREGGRP